MYTYMFVRILFQRLQRHDEVESFTRIKAQESFLNSVDGHKLCEFSVQHRPITSAKFTQLVSLSNEVPRMMLRNRTLKIGLCISLHSLTFET